MKQNKQLLLHYLSGEGKEYYLSYKNLYWRLEPFTQSSVRGAINELIKNELIAKIERNNRPWFRITNIGSEQYQQLFSGGRQTKTWDFRWRFLIVISGKMGQVKQRFLRKLLDEEGFKRLERGVYVTPNLQKQDFKKRLIDSDLLSMVRLVETRRFIIGDESQFASQVWGLDTIYNKQNLLIRQAERVLYRVRRAKRLTDQLKTDYRKLQNKWFIARKSDPMLPKQLLFEDWPGEKLASVMAKLGKCVLRLEQESIVR